MRINGAALNRVTLNGGGSVHPVRFESSSTLVFGTALNAVLRICAEGEVTSGFQARLSSRAIRFMEAEAIAAYAAPDLGLYAIRAAEGVVCLDSVAELYYTRAVPFYGAAITSFAARGDVGIVFGEGCGRVVLESTADGGRSRRDAATAVLLRAGSLWASAERRAKAESSSNAFHAEMDTALIRDGTRIIDGSGALIAQTLMVDNAMMRQSMLGAAEIGVAATGEGRVVRRPLPSRGIAHILSDGALRVYRMGDAEGWMAVSGEVRGDILVRGEAEGMLVCRAEVDGYVLRRTLNGEAVTQAVSDFIGVRLRTGEGTSEIAFDVSGGGVRGRVIDVDLVLTTTGIQDAIINPFAVDDDSQQFSRPSRMPAFVRPSVLRLRARR